MTAPGPPRLAVRLSECGEFVEMSGGAWSNRIHVSALPAWQRFYRTLAGGQINKDRKAKSDPGLLAEIYGPTADALDRVAAELRVRSNS